MFHFLSWYLALQIPLSLCCRRLFSHLTCSFFIFFLWEPAVNPHRLGHVQVWYLSEHSVFIINVFFHPKLTSCLFFFFSPKKYDFKKNTTLQHLFHQYFIKIYLNKSSSTINRHILRAVYVICEDSACMLSYIHSLQSVLSFDSMKWDSSVGWVCVKTHTQAGGCINSATCS